MSEGEMTEAIKGAVAQNLDCLAAGKCLSAKHDCLECGLMFDAVESILSSKVGSHTLGELAELAKRAEKVGGRLIVLTPPKLREGLAIGEEIKNAD